MAGLFEMMFPISYMQIHKHKYTNTVYTQMHCLQEKAAGSYGWVGAGVGMRGSPLVWRHTCLVADFVQVCNDKNKGKTKTMTKTMAKTMTMTKTVTTFGNVPVLLQTSYRCVMTMTMTKAKAMTMTKKMTMTMTKTQ